MMITSTATATKELKYCQEEYDHAINLKDAAITGWKNLAETYLKDSNIVIAALRNEAEEREWCDEYNRFVDDVNEQTQQIKLERTETEHEVEVEVTRIQTQRIVVTLTAANYDSAVDDFNMNDEHYANQHIDEDEWEEQSVGYEVTD